MFDFITKYYAKKAAKKATAVIETEIMRCDVGSPELRIDAALVAKAIKTPGADLNVRSMPGTGLDTGQTLLHKAVLKNQYNIAELLITHKADTNAVDKHNRSPLYYSIIHSHDQMAALLMKNEADLKSCIKPVISLLTTLDREKEQDMKMLHQIENTITQVPQLKKLHEAYTWEKYQDLYGDGPSPHFADKVGHHQGDALHPAPLEHHIHHSPDSDHIH